MNQMVKTCWLDQALYRKNKSIKYIYNVAENFTFEFMSALKGTIHTLKQSYLLLRVTNDTLLRTLISVRLYNK
jgi:hypothetical protein